MKISKGCLALTVIIFIIIVDQVLKLWVKTNFYLGEDYPLTSWFHLKFIENNGMAFGLEFFSKLALTLGRICAVAFFIWAIIKLKSEKCLRKGFIVAISLITAGAAGNIFDCVFYGELFNNPMPPALAEFLPDAGGYAGLFEGRVVDMLYFPLFSFWWPDWMPFVGGKHFEFFQYIFNIADASICVGVFLLIFFYSSDVSLAIARIRNEKEDDETE